MKIALFYNIPSGGAKRTIYETTKRISLHHQIDVYTFSTAGHEFADIRPYVNNYHIFEYHFTPRLTFPFGRFNNALRLSDLLRMDQKSKLVARSIDSGSYDLAYVHPCQVTQSPLLLQHLKKFLRFITSTSHPEPYTKTGLAVHFIRITGPASVRP